MEHIRREKNFSNIVSPATARYRHRMITQTAKSIGALILVSFAVGACTTQEPYIERPYAIDREHANFPNGPDIVAGLGFTVCYSKSDTSPAAIRAVAEEECQRGGLYPRFIEQTFDQCTLMAPVAAVFRCETGAGPKPAMRSSSNVSAPVFSSPASPGGSRPLGTLGAADVSTTAKSKPFPTFLFNDGQTAK